MVLFLMLSLAMCFVSFADARCPGDVSESPDVGVYLASLSGEGDATIVEWTQSCTVPMAYPYDSSKNSILIMDPAGKEMYSESEFTAFVVKWVRANYNVGITNLTDDAQIEAAWQT